MVHSTIDVGGVIRESTLGAFVNRDGRIQRFWPAKAAPGMARPAWWVAGEVLAAEIA